jgi:shikimate 5-dehydrogenase
MTFDSPHALTVSHSLSITTLDQLFKMVGLLPPLNATEVYVSQIETAVNDLLQPINKNFSVLEPHEQAKLSFLLLRGQSKLLREKGLSALDVANTHC